VAAVRDDVEVAVLEDRDQPVAFLPFQRSRRNVGKPVGDGLNDFQGLIGSAAVTCDPIELLQACGLKAWHFNHLICEQGLFSAFVRREADSPFADLSDGFNAFLSHRKNGRSLMSEFRQKSRKLSREVGPLRFEFHVNDRVVLKTLFAWKSEHIRRAGAPSIIDYSWVRGLIERIHAYQSPDFSGVLSVLYAADRVAAISFGMRSRSVLHEWFNTYNLELARCSPGLLCWIETLKMAASSGIRRLDFGKGSAEYKHRLMSGATKVAEGTVDVSRGTALARRASWVARRLIRTSPLAKPAISISQRARNIRHWLDLRSTDQGRYT
jgi:CelD/BcsL family acetyltransferase involved in cellulose biosynthesis